MEERMKKSLTGNYYFKPTLLGLVLMVEIEYSYYDVPKDLSAKEEKKVFKTSKESIKEFVKATVSQAFELNLISIPTKPL